MAMLGRGATPLGFGTQRLRVSQPLGRYTTGLAPYQPLTAGEIQQQGGTLGYKQARGPQARLGAISLPGGVDFNYLPLLAFGAGTALTRHPFGGFLAGMVTDRLTGGLFPGSTTQPTGPGMGTGTRGEFEGTLGPPGQFVPEQYTSPETPGTLAPPTSGIAAPGTRGWLAQANLSDATRVASDIPSDVGAANVMRAWLREHTDGNPALIEGMPNDKLLGGTQLHEPWLEEFGPEALWLDSTQLSLLNKLRNEGTPESDIYSQGLSLIAANKQRYEAEKGRVAGIDALEREVTNLTAYKEQMAADLRGADWYREAEAFATGEEMALGQDYVDRQLRLAEPEINRYFGEQSVGIGMALAGGGMAESSFADQLSQQASTRAMQSKLRVGQMAQDTMETVNLQNKQYFQGLLSQVEGRLQQAQLAVSGIIANLNSRIADFEATAGGIPAMDYTYFPEYGRTIVSSIEEEARFAMSQSPFSQFGQAIGEAGLTAFIQKLPDWMANWFYG